MKINIPRESRRKKSCGTAFVLLPSLDDATKAVDRLNGARGSAEFFVFVAELPEVQVVYNWFIYKIYI